MTLFAWKCASFSTIDFGAAIATSSCFNNRFLKVQLHFALGRGHLILIGGGGTGLEDVSGHSRQGPVLLFVYNTIRTIVVLDIFFGQNSVLEPPLTSTHNLCFGAKIGIPQFCYMKVKNKWVYIIWICFRDFIDIWTSLYMTCMRQVTIHIAIVLNFQN